MESGSSSAQISEKNKRSHASIAVLATTAKCLMPTWCTGGSELPLPLRDVVRTVDRGI